MEKSPSFGSVDKKHFMTRVSNNKSKVNEICVGLRVIKFTFPSLYFSGKEIKIPYLQHFSCFLLTGKNETNGSSDSVISGKLDVISRFRGYFDHGDA